MNSVETIIVFNIIGFTVILLIMFILGWWFLKKQARSASDEARKVVQAEIKKAKQQLVKMNRQMMKDYNVEDSVPMDFSPVVIDSKSIRAVEDIYKAFVVWGKTSADVATKITKLGSQELAGMHATKQEDHLKNFYSEARKALNFSQQLAHQIEFDAAYLDEALVKEMASMAKQTVSLSESLLDHVKKSAEKTKAATARDSQKLYAAMEKQAASIVNFHNVEYKNFVKNSMAQKVRDLRAGMSQAGGEEAFEE